MRIDWHKILPEGYKAMKGLENIAEGSKLEPLLKELIRIRAFRLTDVPIAWICTPKMRALLVKTSKEFMYWLRGAKLRCTLHVKGNDLLFFFSEIENMLNGAKPYWISFRIVRTDNTFQNVNCFIESMTTEFGEVFDITGVCLNGKD